MLPENYWYVVAQSRELRKGKPLALRRFGQELVMWRDEQGRAQAMLDSCPHRNAKLSLGRVRGNEIECPYHGFRFDGSGTCTRAPCEGEGAHLAHLRNESFSLREEHDFIWMWHGDEAPSLDPLPWFNELRGELAFSELHDDWSTSYQRAVESQLDWAHLPFVHRNSIGIGFAHELEVVSEQDGDTIYTWPKHMEREDGTPSFYLRFAFPNVWMNPAGPKSYIFLAFAPIDDENTRIYVRTYQYMVKAPLLRHLYAWVVGAANRFIIGQDRRVVESQPPEVATLARREKLVPADLPIAQFRKRLRQRSRSRPTELVPVEALSRRLDPKDNVA